MSCLFASISKDAPDSLCQMNTSQHFSKTQKRKIKKARSPRETYILFLQNLSREGFNLQIFISALQNHKTIRDHWFKSTTKFQYMQTNAVKKEITGENLSIPTSRDTFKLCILIYRVGSRSINPAEIVKTNFQISQTNLVAHSASSLHQITRHL